MLKGYVYILKSKRDNRYYVGSTNDVKRRLFQHRAGKVYSTRRMLPVKLIFTQEFDSLSEARRIEKRIKKFKNRQVIDKIVQEGRINLGP